MNIIKTTTLLLYLILVGCSSTPSIISNEDTIERVLPSIVSIQSPASKITTPVITVNDVLYPIATGIVIHSEGLIITNAHVVRNRPILFIKLDSGMLEKAEVIGIDHSTDLALIRVPKTFLEGIVPIELGHSNDLKVGQKVFAIGNPLGYLNSVSVGVISGLNRNNLSNKAKFSKVEDYIQTDAAINPGNSGGALINESGKLIGINTILMSASGTSSGLGFAIPSEIVKFVVESILDTGYVTRYKLNISISSFLNSGVLVSNSKYTNVFKGDIITHMNGIKVRSIPHYHARVSLLFGSPMTELTILRANKPVKVLVNPYKEGINVK